MPVHAYVFEGGASAGPLSADVAKVREHLTLERLDLLREAGASRIGVVSDRPGLLEAARDRRASTRWSAPPFHLGEVLRDLVAETVRSRDDAWVLYVGGGAAALLDVSGWRRLFQELADPREMWVNNPQSPDVVAFMPASLPAEALASGATWPRSDNGLGYFLEGLGLRRRLWPNDPALNFDVDTPAEVGLMRWLAERTGAGLPSPDVGQALSSLDWAGALARRFDHVSGVLADGGELALLGRVGPTAVARLNERWKCRVRVFSEERGMKALGRPEAGLVRSLVGLHADAVGPERFFEALAQVADAVLFDTRVLFAHWRSTEGEEGRFAADLGRAQAVRDPRVKAFSSAAWGCRAPVIMGGHTLVYGGLWTLSEALYQAMNGKTGQ